MMERVYITIGIIHGLRKESRVGDFLLLLLLGSIVGFLVLGFVMIY